MKPDPAPRITALKGPARRKPMRPDPVRLDSAEPVDRRAALQNPALRDLRVQDLGVQDLEVQDLEVQDLARAARDAGRNDGRDPMRVVGGRLKGRALQGPATQEIRPTSDRLRETIFNVLAHAYGDPVEGARVIDLFAGTGAMGFEAISRGAERALFVDDGSMARALIRANVETLGLGGATKIFRRDARKLGAAPAGDAFTLAFLDPPYGKGLAEPALVALRDGGWLTQDALLVVEEAVEAILDIPAGFTALEKRIYGDTQVVILKAEF
jgi:16S rRNA (guanine966-N2)-methyltransferase